MCAIQPQAPARPSPSAAQIATRPTYHSTAMRVTIRAANHALRVAESNQTRNETRGSSRVTRYGERHGTARRTEHRGRQRVTRYRWRATSFRVSSAPSRRSVGGAKARDRRGQCSMMQAPLEGSGKRLQQYTVRCMCARNSALEQRRLRTHRSRAPAVRQGPGATSSSSSAAHVDGYPSMAIATSIAP